MARTAIEWTEASWNPIVGCSVVSPGCTNCYAMKMADRLAHMAPQPHGAGNPHLIHYLGTTTRGDVLSKPPVWTGKVKLAPEHVLRAPLRRRKPTTYFVNSMGDLFHESVPDEWIDRVFAVMALAPQHTFQVLTKRASRMRAYLSTRAGDWSVIWPDANPPGSLPISRHEQRLAMRGAGWPDAILRPTFPLKNVWLGVSAEDQRRADERVPELLATPASVRFVSAEPLLGSIDFRDITIPQKVGTWQVNALDCDCPPDEDTQLGGATLDWIIVGGESGPNARPMHPAWARQIRDQCAAAGTAFFFKQWGEWLPIARVGEGGKAVAAALPAHHVWSDTTVSHRVGKKAAGRLLDSVEHNAMPERADG